MAVFGSQDKPKLTRENVMAVIAFYKRTTVQDLARQIKYTANVFGTGSRKQIEEWLI